MTRTRYREQTTTRDFVVYGDDDVVYRCEAKYHRDGEGCVTVTDIYTPAGCPTWRDDRLERAADDAMPLTSAEWD